MINVAPARERGLKYHILLTSSLRVNVAPARERGLKYQGYNLQIRQKLRRSREGAWIEIPDKARVTIYVSGRSREGAWIEIDKYQFAVLQAYVAPARERGLK